MGGEDEIENFEKIEKDLEKGGLGLLFLCFFGAVERPNLSGRAGGVVYDLWDLKRCIYIIKNYHIVKKKCNQIIKLNRRKEND